MYPVVSRVTQILMTGILSLLFSVQAFGITVDAGSMPMGDNHCAMIAYAAMDCGDSNVDESVSVDCQSQQEHCQGSDGCSASHCSVGSALTGSDHQFSKAWVTQPIFHAYIGSLPLPPASTPYKPPKA